MGRAPCCDKANVKKGPWSPEEDAKLKSYIEQHGTGGNWIALPQKIGLKRCGKSCRLRWLNYLRPNIKHGGFSEEEENIICSLYVSIGSRWSVIAAQLPGRTDNDIKNYWNTRLKKKLLGKYRKEQEARKQQQEGTKERGASANPLMMVVENSSSQQQPYWPQMPVLAPPFPNYSNQDPCFNDQDSIRNLLIKLGGRFSHHDHYLPSLDANLNNIIIPPADDQFIPQPQQIYEEQVKRARASSSSCCINMSNNGITIDNKQQVAELREMTGAVVDGVEELLYGEEDMMVNIDKIIGPTIWSESDTTTTSLIYPPLPPSTLTATPQQYCAFQHHLSYHGP